MAGRKLSRQQQKRIRSAQAAVSAEDDDHYEALVISHHGGKVIVENEAAREIECSVKSNLGAIVCGDRVIYKSLNKLECQLVSILARENLLQRLDGFGQLKSVAANLTQILVCLSVKPEPNLFLLDQYLVSAEQQGINPVIILNKIDLLPDSTRDPFQLESIYTPMNYRVLAISVKSGEGMTQLGAMLDRQTTVLSGVSGVGKSSITQALLPEVEIKIGQISEANEEGKHTTRTSRLYHLGDKGRLIDTPGVRGFNPALDLNASIADGFREIAKFANHCRFANCQHLKEPGCAVTTALSSGEIADSRYAHYLRLKDRQTD